MATMFTRCRQEAGEGDRFFLFNIAVFVRNCVPVRDRYRIAEQDCQSFFHFRKRQDVPIYRRHRVLYPRTCRGFGQESLPQPVAGLRPVPFPRRYRSMWRPGWIYKTINPLLSRVFNISGYRPVGTLPKSRAKKDVEADSPLLCSL